MIYATCHESFWRPLPPLYTEANRLEQRLTKRERDVLGLLVDGHTNREIANRLEIREQTVKDHVSALVKKFQTRSRVALAVAAVRAGF